MSAVNYQVEAVLLRALITANFTECQLFGPNERVVPPVALQDGSQSWGTWDIADYSAQLDTFGGPIQKFTGALSMAFFQEENFGDALIRSHVDRMDQIVLASQAAISDPANQFTGFALKAHGLAGGPLVWGEEGNQWYGREYRAEWERTDTVSAEEVVVLAGIGRDTALIPAVAHGFSVKDWVGYDIGAGEWARVVAEVDAPEVLGIVTDVRDADHFTLTTTGAGVLALPSHGYAIGTLYLSQVTAGAAVSTPPESGVSQVLAVVYDADNLILISRQAVVL